MGKFVVAGAGTHEFIKLGPRGGVQFYLVDGATVNPAPWHRVGAASGGRGHADLPRMFWPAPLDLQ
jgi:hypothetical protein